MRKVGYNGIAYRINSQDDKNPFSCSLVVSIEDPFDQDHWQAWSNLTAQTNIQIVGLVKV
jgi:hypothetical protein